MSPRPPDRAGPAESGALHESPSETPLYEWVIAALSALLVAGVVGFLLYDALVLPPGPARITVAADTVIPVQEGYLVRYTARNEGRSTATAVQIEGALREAGREVERAAATIDYLPPQATRTGGFFFERDPRRFELRLQPAGYGDP